MGAIAIIVSFWINNYYLYCIIFTNTLSYAYLSKLNNSLCIPFPFYKVLWYKIFGMTIFFRMATILYSSFAKLSSLQLMCVCCNVGQSLTGAPPLHPLLIDVAHSKVCRADWLTCVCVSVKCVCDCVSTGLVYWQLDGLFCYASHRVGASWRNKQLWWEVRGVFQKSEEFTHR